MRTVRLVGRFPSPIGLNLSMSVGCSITLRRCGARVASTGTYAAVKVLMPEGGLAGAARLNRDHSAVRRQSPVPGTRDKNGYEDAELQVVKTAGLTRSL